MSSQKHDQDRDAHLIHFDHERFDDVCSNELKVGVPPVRRKQPQLGVPHPQRSTYTQWLIAVFEPEKKLSSTTCNMGGRVSKARGRRAAMRSETGGGPHDVVPTAHEAVDKVASDESCTTGDEDALAVLGGESFDGRVGGC